MTKKPAKGHTRKHTGTKKHKQTAKHHPAHHKAAATAHGTKVHTVAKHPQHAKARGLALGDAVPVCAAEALAMLARLAGHRVSDDDVLALHQMAGGDDEDGALIVDVLAAAAQYGLAGVRLAGFAECLADDPPLPGGQLLRHRTEIDPGETGDRSGQGLARGVILGVDLPGPHTLAVDGRGRCWSWGRPWSPSDFRAAVVDEAWAVSWA